MITSKHVEKAVRTALANPSIRRATVIVSPTETVVVSRRHKFDRRSTRNEFVVTVGKPNYENREFIKAAKRGGEPFPIKRVLVKTR